MKRLTDLDRCEHGRHAKDHCLACPSSGNTGNLHARGQASMRVRIGNQINGEAIYLDELPGLIEAYRTEQGNTIARLMAHRDESLAELRAANRALRLVQEEADRLEAKVLGLEATLEEHAYTIEKMREAAHQLEKRARANGVTA